jgi:hypothetical protein
METILDVMFKLRNINMYMENKLQSMEVEKWNTHWYKNPNLHAFLPHFTNSEKRERFFNWLSMTFNIPAENHIHNISMACSYKKGIDIVMNREKVENMINSLSFDDKQSLLTLFNEQKTFMNFLSGVDPSLLPEIFEYISKNVKESELTAHGCFCNFQPPSSITSPSHSSTLSLEQLKSIPRLGPGIRSMDRLRAIMGEKN